MYARLLPTPTRSTFLFGPRGTCYGVYLGERAAQWDDTTVLPMQDFLRRLWAGDVIR